jgi:hypothetical protein
MSGVARTLTAAEMFGRDLGRRWLALVLLVALPVIFYLVSRASEGGHAFTAGGLGLSWAIAGASLFTALGARGVDQRLVFDGYRPIELLGARLLLLDAAGVVLSALFATLLILDSGTPDLGVLVVALVLVALVAVPLGLVLAVLVPHELEATLLLIGLIGIEMILPSEGSIVGGLPLGGPQELLDRAAGKAHPVAVVTAVGRSALWIVALTIVGALIWRWRTRVHRPGIPDLVAPEPVEA